MQEWFVNHEEGMKLQEEHGRGMWRGWASNTCVNHKENKAWGDLIDANFGA